MAIQNVLIAKIVGVVSLIGGAGSAGVVYRAEIANQLQNIFGKNESKDYFFVVAGTVDASSEPQSEKALYDAAESKTKNYQCQIGSEKYECDIVKEITKEATKKWINTKSYFSNTAPDKAGVTKEKIKAENNLFLLKILGTKKPLLTWSETEKIDIIEKEIPKTDKTTATTKKFGQLKPIFGKKNNEILGNVNLFLAQVSSDGTNTIGTGTKNCYFDYVVAIKKSCEIYQFTATQPTTLDNKTPYTSSNFVGTNLTEEQKIKTDSAIKQYEWYLIKFTGDLKNSDFSGKRFVSVEGSSHTRINFFTPIVSFMYPHETGTENNNLLIIND